MCFSGVEGEESVCISRDMHMYAQCLLELSECTQVHSVSVNMCMSAHKYVHVSFVHMYLHMHIYTFVSRRMCLSVYV